MFIYSQKGLVIWTHGIYIVQASMGVFKLILKLKLKYFYVILFFTSDIKVLCCLSQNAKSRFNKPI